MSYVPPYLIRSKDEGLKEKQNHLNIIETMVSHSFGYSVSYGAFTRLLYKKEDWEGILVLRYLQSYIKGMVSC